MDVGKLIAEYGDDFARLLFELAPKLYKLFRLAGGRDGVLVALDAALESARAAHDEELRRKHGR